MSRVLTTEVTSLVPFRAPFAATPLLEFLRARAIPGVEAVDEKGYRRTVEVGGEVSRVDVAVLVPDGHIAVRLARAATPPDDAATQREAVERIAQLFDVHAEPQAIAACLGDDEILRPRVARVPGLRVPGAWDAFELGVRAILGQQVTVKGASTLAGRLVKLCGRPFRAPADGLTHLFPAPADLARADLAEVGLPSRRQETLRQFAHAAAAGVLTLPPRDAVNALLELPGIGDWTTQYMLMRAWRDADAFPASDLWLRRSAGEETVRALLARADRWRPWRAYAAMYLWQVPGA